MDQITKLSNHASPILPRKGRRLSYHGSAQHAIKVPSELQSIISSNLLIQNQLAIMCEELVKGSLKCGELSEVEGKKKDL